MYHLNTVDIIITRRQLCQWHTCQKSAPKTGIPESRCRFLACLTCSLVPNFSGTRFLVRVFGPDFWYVCHGHYNWRQVLLCSASRYGSVGVCSIFACC